ncbi:hypothetical protein M9Y10_023730 [Tritrichomonas musculus]|uniref:Uncharacterized protein n=1 Tax=Tritrichomonas musculus TaxID=1915356 RepID=A0ABR2KVY9_9EUKA
MYHKLGRPRRTIKAETIIIQEDGCLPVVYRLDNRGNIVLDSQVSKENQEKDKNNQGIETENNKDKIHEIKINAKPTENKYEDLSDINYYLNKKPFPSLIDYEADPLSLAIIQPLLVI